MEHPGASLNVWRRLRCHICRYSHTHEEGAAKYFYSGFVHRLMVCSMYGLSLRFSILSQFLMQRIGGFIHLFFEGTGFLACPQTTVDRF